MLDVQDLLQATSVKFKSPAFPYREGFFDGEYPIRHTSAFDQQKETCETLPQGFPFCLSVSSLFCRLSISPTAPPGSGVGHQAMEMIHPLAFCATFLNTHKRGSLSI